MSYSARDFISDNRFTLLLCFLVLLFLSGPLHDGLSYNEWYLFIRTAVIASALIITVKGISPAPQWRKILVMLFISVVVLAFITPMIKSNTFQISTNILMVCYLFLIEAIVLNYIGNKKQVDRDTLSAALCGYAILVVLFASVYALVDSIYPGSFRFPPELYTGEEPVEISNSALSMYFSLVTITTLGYGDISPVSHLARVLASLEAFIGQAYLAILIARLVGLHLLNRD